MLPTSPPLVSPQGRRQPRYSSLQFRFPAFIVAISPCSIPCGYLFLISLARFLFPDFRRLLLDFPLLRFKSLSTEHAMTSPYKCNPYIFNIISKQATASIVHWQILCMKTWMVFLYQSKKYLFSHKYKTGLKGAMSTIFVLHKIAPW